MVTRPLRLVFFALAHKNTTAPIGRLEQTFENPDFVLTIVGLFGNAWFGNCPRVLGASRMIKKPKQLVALASLIVVALRSL